MRSTIFPSFGLRVLDVSARHKRWFVISTRLQRWDPALTRSVLSAWSPTDSICASPFGLTREHGKRVSLKPYVSHLVCSVFGTSKVNRFIVFMALARADPPTGYIWRAAVQRHHPVLSVTRIGSGASA